MLKSDREANMYNGKETKYVYFGIKIGVNNKEKVNGTKTGIKIQMGKKILLPNLYLRTNKEHISINANP